MSLPPPKPSGLSSLQGELLRRREEEFGRRRFDPGRKIQAIRPIYTLVGRAISTPGNLTTISAEAKSGKSAAMAAMMSSVMVPSDDTTRDTLGFWSSNPGGLALLHFDSEQSPDDHCLLIRRTLNRAGFEKPPTWFYSYYLTGLSAVESWKFVKDATVKATQECGGVHSILIDGSADLVIDVNDSAQSNAFVAELHGLAIIHDCPVINVIHLNPGGTKTRGHLGSQLERKSETNLRLEKDDEGVTEMWSDKQRRAPIPQGTGPCFQWSNQHDMHVSVQNPADAKSEAKASAKVEELKVFAQSVYSRVGKSASSRKD